MPDWENYYATVNGFTATQAASQIQQQFEEWQRSCEQQDRIMEQMIRDEEERIEDRRKYPLFFLKEGTV